MSKTGLEGLSPLHLLCYAYGHRWMFYSQDGVKAGLVTDRFMCQCGNSKFETWTKKTRVSWGRAWYRYVPGYQLGYRVTREDAKQEIRRRGQQFWSELNGG